MKTIPIKTFFFLIVLNYILLGLFLPKKPGIPSDPKAFLTEEELPWLKVHQDIEKGVLAHKWPADNFPGIDLLSCENTKDAIEVLSSGKAFGCIGYLKGPSRIINTYGFKKFNATAPSSLPGLTDMEISNDWPELLDIMNKEIDSLTENEEASIINKWFKGKLKYGLMSHNIVKWALIICFITGLIISAFFVWNSSLKLMVKEYIIKVQKSEDRLNEAQAVAHVGSWDLDLLKDQLHCSDETHRIFSIPIGTPIVYSKFLEYVYPDDRKYVNARWTAALQGEPYDIEHRILVGDKVKWVRERAIITFDENGRAVKGIGTIQDITNLKQTEKALQEQSILLHLAIETGRVGSWHWDLQTNKFYTSPEWKHQLGIDNNNISDLCKEWDARLHPDDRQRSWQAFNQWFKGKSPIYASEFRLRHEDGSYRWFYNRCEKELDEKGNPIHVHGCHVDITELRQMKAKLERILTLSHDLICIAGIDGFFKYVNPAWEKSLGYTRDELISRPILDFIHPDDYKKNDQGAEKLSSGKQTINFESRCFSKDGSIRYIQWTATPVLDEGVMYCIGRDITERKQTEEEKARLKSHLKLSDKMESIGILISGIAYDFCNVLTSIIGFTELALMPLDNAKKEEYLQHVYIAGMRAKDIVKQILVFAKQSEEETSPAQVDEIEKLGKRG